MKLRCYCCGEPLTGEIALMTNSHDSVDRVFVLKPDHVERVDDTAKCLLVSPSTTRVPK